MTCARAGTECGWRAAEIRAAARERLGFDELRRGQEETIRALLDGRDALVVMPTGSGKSAIYQLAGVLLPGTTVVVSPLIALQRDQVEALEETDAEAAELNATLIESERKETLEDVERDEVDFLFLAPEQFANEETLTRLRAATSRSSSSTRRTASASGGTTSGRITSVSARSRQSSADRASSPSPRRPRRRCGPRSSSG